MRRRRESRWGQRGMVPLSKRFGGKGREKVSPSEAHKWRGGLTNGTTSLTGKLYKDHRLDQIGRNAEM